MSRPRPVHLGLGSNLGDRRAHLRAALERISDVARIDAISGVYRSEPTGYREQPDFWNLVAAVSTDLEPESLLEATQRIEETLGRRRTFRNAPRPIDIDVLLYDDVVMESPELVVPHPRMLDRAFVLRPLLELAPDARHPVTGACLAEHLRSRDNWERTERLFDGTQLLE